jgi:hypothetical protein
VKRLLSCKNAVVAGIAVLATNAFAVIDTTAAVQEVTDAGTAMAAVGGAILVLSGISLAYRWVKATFF